MLLWSVAARRQLDRWEPLVETFIRSLLAKTEMDPASIWQGEAEYHFLLVALNHMIEAADIKSTVAFDQTFRDEIIDTRHLLEHWRDNMEAFNTTPRVKPPARRSGKNYATRHPRSSPYSWRRYGDPVGAMVTPDVSAVQVRAELDKVDAAVLKLRPKMARFIR